jgi:hypothetical protein
LGEEEMVNTVLTKEMIEAGAALIKKLENSNIQPDAAFWLYYPDGQKWKLVLAEVKLADEGPKKIYQKIQETLALYGEEFQDLSLEDITLAQPNASIVTLLRQAIGTRQGMGLRFTNSVINGNFIDDAYIYRLV